MPKPVTVIRDIDSNQNLGRQIQVFADRIQGAGTATVTVETKCKTVVSAVVVNETDGVLVAPTVANSTIYSGTKKVSFNIANGKTYSYIITCIYGIDRQPVSVSANTVFTYQPV